MVSKAKKICLTFFRVLITTGIIAVGILILGFILHSADASRFSNTAFNDIFVDGMKKVFEVDNLKAIYKTLYLTGKGLAIGLFFGFFLSIVLGLMPRFVPRLLPLFNSIRAIPLTLFIPFLIAVPVFWPFPPGINEAVPSKEPSYLIGLGTLLYLIIGIAEGISERNIERESILKKIYKFSTFQYYRRVIIYEAMPQFFTSIRMAILFAFVLAIVLEQLIGYTGIGWKIKENIENSTYFDHNEGIVLAMLFVISLIGVLIDALYLIIKGVFFSFKEMN